MPKQLCGGRKVIVAGRQRGARAAWSRNARVAPGPIGATPHAETLRAAARCTPAGRSWCSIGCTAMEGAGVRVVTASGGESLGPARRHEECFLTAFFCSS